MRGWVLGVVRELARVGERAYVDEMTAGSDGLSERLERLGKNHGRINCLKARLLIVA
jgi:hypothetical protein